MAARVVVTVAVALLSAAAHGREHVQTHRNAEAIATAPGRTELNGQDLASLLALGYVDGHDSAPAATGVSVHDRERIGAGVNLVVSGHDAEVLLIANDGSTLHRWAFSRDVAFPSLARLPTPEHRDRRHFRRARLLPNGDLLAIYEGVGIIRLDAHSRLLWAHQGWNHHDLDLDSEGNIHVLARRRKVVPALRPTPIIEDLVQTLRPDGTLVAEQSLLECLRRSSSHARLFKQLVPAEDVLHTNTVRVLDGALAHSVPVFARDNLLLSMRELDLLLIVEPRPCKVVWALHGVGHRQHEPSLLPSGHMLLFDNLAGPHTSRVVELDPRTGVVTWLFTAAPGQPFFSATCGSAQRLDNGNTLITESERGRALEVLPSGEVVWEYWNPMRAGRRREKIATLFEVRRYPLVPYHPDAWQPSLP